MLKRNKNKRIEEYIQRKVDLLLPEALTLEEKSKGRYVPVCLIEDDFKSFIIKYISNII